MFVNFGLEMAPVTPEMRARYNLMRSSRVWSLQRGSRQQHQCRNGDHAGARHGGPTPDDVLTRVSNERGQKRSFVLMLLSEPA